MDREAWGKTSTTDHSNDELAAPENDESSVRTLLRGLNILGLFDVNHPAWTFTEISRQTGLSNATANRLIKTLMSRGFLRFDVGEGKYHLGASMLRALYLLMTPTEFAGIAHPHLEKLAADTGETAAACLWTEQGPLTVDIVFTWRAIRPLAVVGEMFTGFSDANSKLFLALCPEERRRVALSKPLPRLTEFSIVDPNRLLDELDRIRQEGVAYDLQEHDLGICAVGAAVWDSTGTARGSISLVAPVERFGPGEMRRNTDRVKAAALALSRDLGYRGT